MLAELMMDLYHQVLVTMLVRLYRTITVLLVKNDLESGEYRNAVVNLDSLLSLLWAASLALSSLLYLQIAIVPHCVTLVLLGGTAPHPKLKGL
eukprot:scaffold146167_cov18-Tisochrysis_lutea.AAC.2